MSDTGEPGDTGGGAEWTGSAGGTWSANGPAPATDSPGPAAPPAARPPEPEQDPAPPPDRTPADETPADVVAADVVAADETSAEEVPADGDTPGEPDRLPAAVEAVLLVVDTPVDTADLARVFEVPAARMAEVLAGLRDEYDEQCRGFTLREVAGGWRLYTREDYASYVERYLLDGQQTRLTQAALETLAVVAYRQPVTRSRVAAIRGVGVDGVMRTLLTRGLVEECGTDADTGGNLYRTTSLFLEKLGLRSLDELPSLAPLLPEIDSVDDVATSG